MTVVLGSYEGGGTPGELIQVTISLVASTSRAFRSRSSRSGPRGSWDASSRSRAASSSKRASKEVVEGLKRRRSCIAATPHDYAPLSPKTEKAPTSSRRENLSLRVPTDVPSQVPFLAPIYSDIAAILRIEHLEGEEGLFTAMSAFAFAGCLICPHAGKRPKGPKAPARVAV